MSLLKQEALDRGISDSEVVFSNDFVSLRSSGDEQVAVTVGTGRGAVALVLWNQKVLMFRTPRYATDTMEWELPRGGSFEDESSLETASRCVEGLTGVAVEKKSMRSLGTMTPEPELLTNEVELIFLTSAKGVIRANHENSKWVHLESLVSACLEGEVQDSFTCMAVLRARLNGII